MAPTKWLSFACAAGALLVSTPAGVLNEDGGAGFFRLQSAELPEYTRLGLSFFNRIVNTSSGLDGLNSMLASKTVIPGPGYPNAGIPQQATLSAFDHVLAASISTNRFLEFHVAVPLYNQDLTFGSVNVVENRAFEVGDLRYGFKLALPIGKKQSPLAAAILFGGSLPTSSPGTLPMPRRLEYFPHNDSIMNANSSSPGSRAAGTARDDWHIGGAMTLDLENSALPLPVQFHVNAGGRKTSALTPADSDFFDIFSAGVGFQGNVSQYASFLAEYWHEDRMEQNDPAHLDDISLGLAFHIPIGISFMIGAGFALGNSTTDLVHYYNTSGVNEYSFVARTSPNAQVMLAASYTSLGPQDRDHDGITDKLDKCPDDPEDYDKFEDEDGCPDPDNDKDGILDVKDKCPNDPEDLDGFQDEDGCPDADNDKDTICDPWVTEKGQLGKYASLCKGLDKCPNEAGPAEFDGCPVRDKDGDGITDDKDKCPNDPEDKDGFEDEDGCPDPDNDKDGICDPWIAEKGQSGKYAAVCKLADKCPMDPEDIDGFEDDDGCPDPDNDKDAICDPWVAEKGQSGKYATVCKGTDKCPNQPETVNAYQDDDGCPDTAPIQQKTLVLRGVNFETGKATLLAESYPVLDDVAGQLVAAPEVEIEVSGHTDNRSGYQYNMDLSRARAQTVTSYLISKGVAASRLRVSGYGYTKPIASNRTAEGRLQNRRVQFDRTK